MNIGGFFIKTIDLDHKSQLNSVFLDRIQHIMKKSVRVYEDTETILFSAPKQPKVAWSGLSRNFSVV